MSTITIPRSDVTVEEVSAVLRRTLGSRYRVTPSMMAAGFGKEVPGDAYTILVAANGRTSGSSMRGTAPRST